MQLMTVAALTDALTGLGNRRAFDRDLEIEIARAGRHSTSLSVLILDLDGLKAVNDGLGHQAGDLLLRCVGDELRRAFRLEDRIYRLGGDEFALLLPHTSGDYSLPARQRLDGVRSAVRARGFEHVDFSTGLATFPQEAFSSTSLWQLADSRMYEEKLAHRRVGRSSISNELVQTLTEPPPSAV
jgi:diguanylate cyclase (GGDEF)-like protein